MALGAFFAGLVYSRDPEAVKVSRPFSVLYDLFTPFFFVAIGFHIDPQVVGTAVVPGLGLLAAATTGKCLGAGGAAVPTIGWTAAGVLGLSMLPRAEIAMVIMRHGREAGESVIPADAFAGMVFVSAATCFLSPLILRPMLSRWRQPADSNGRPADAEANGYSDTTALVRAMNVRALGVLRGEPPLDLSLRLLALLAAIPSTGWDERQANARRTQSERGQSLEPVEL